MLALGLAATAACAAPPRYLAARDITLEFQAGNRVPVTTAELWVSTDGRRNWRRTATATAGAHALHYTAAADGVYDCYVVLKNAGGTSGPPPGPGTAATATVVVDTLAPLLQIHAARIAARSADEDQAPASAPAQPRTVNFDLTLVEEHLSESGLRAFYKTAAGDWHDGGPVQFTADSAAWTAPPELSGTLDVRLVATDLAGNRAQEDVRGLDLPAALAPAAPAADPPPAASQPSDANARTSTPGPLTPNVSPRAVVEAQHLRGLAARFLDAGRFSLAAARFEDALAATPGDADLLADLGQVLIRLNRLEDADARFHAALDAAPDHARALDGLALVAATQRRYPQAREYLLRLQQLQPDVGGVWLRSGDIEHRLGNLTQALEDWERARTRSGKEQELRDKAERRLEYFGPQRTERAPNSAAKAQWPKPTNHPPSSSSAETKTTRNPSR
jgi:hypothetical protein